MGILVAFTAMPASGFSFHANGGPSVPTGDNGDAWNPGLSIRGWGYQPVTPNLSLGFGMDVNWYTLDNMGIVYDQNSSIDWNNTGDMFLIEIGPSLRVHQAGTEEKTVSFFGEAGLSFFHMSQSGTVRGSAYGYTASQSFASDDNYVGITLGGGITIGNGPVRFEILPLVHFPFDMDTYFTLTGGIVFGR